MKTTSKPYNLGLVLSGGGVRGLSHVGAVKALIEAGADFDIISGTSIGAIVGVLLADGYHPDEISALVEQSNRKDFVRPSITKDHLLSFDALKRFLKKHLHADKFEDLKIPLVVAATDLVKGQMRYFREGDLIEKVIASASIPVIFQPVDIEGNLYVDGGLLSNLPVQVIREDCEKIIGVSVNPESLGLEHDKKMNNILQIAERSFHVVMYGNVVQEKDLCDLFIEPYLLNDYGIFSFDKMQEIETLGYNFTKDVLNKIGYN